jgi:trk system potassium uptake protein
MHTAQQVRPVLNGLNRNTGMEIISECVYANPAVRVFIFYSSLILAGLVALTFFPVLEERPLSLMDALFTSVSAVTLTGLSTVSVSLFSRQGQWIMLVLMQTGGIGILYFASRLLIIPGRSASRSQHMMVRERWSEVNELAPKKLTQNIILGVLSLEILGTTILYFLFSGNGVDSPFFVSLFHSVSALVNGGFTTFTAGNLELLTTAPIAAALGILILLGRLGYVVFAEVFQKTTHKSHQWRILHKVFLSHEFFRCF